MPLALVALVVALCALIATVRGTGLLTVILLFVAIAVAIAMVVAARKVPVRRNLVLGIGGVLLAVVLIISAVNGDSGDTTAGSSTSVASPGPGSTQGEPSPTTSTVDVQSSGVTTTAGGRSTTTIGSTTSTAPVPPSESLPSRQCRLVEITPQQPLPPGTRQVTDGDDCTSLVGEIAVAGEVDEFVLGLVAGQRVSLEATLCGNTMEVSGPSSSVVVEPMYVGCGVFRKTFEASKGDGSYVVRVSTPSDGITEEYTVQFFAV